VLGAIDDSHLSDPKTANGLLGILHLVVVLSALPTTPPEHQKALWSALRSCLADLNARFKVQIDGQPDITVDSFLVDVLIEVGVSIHQLGLWAKEYLKDGCATAKDLFHRYAQVWSQWATNLTDLESRIYDQVRDPERRDETHDFGWCRDFSLVPVSTLLDA
jgi:hypothetical protein